MVLQAYVFGMYGAKVPLLLCFTYGFHIDFASKIPDVGNKLLVLGMQDLKRKGFFVHGKKFPLNLRILQVHVGYDVVVGV